MKIYQTKPFTRFMLFYLVALGVANLWLNTTVLTKNTGWFMIWITGFTLWIVGFLAAVLIWKNAQVQQRQFFLSVIGSIVYFHGLTLFHRSVRRVFLNLDAFEHFSTKKAFLVGEYLFGKRRSDGRTVRLMNASLYEKTAAEIMTLFNETKGPVVADYREDPHPGPGGMVA